MHVNTEQTEDVRTFFALLFVPDGRPQRGSAAELLSRHHVQPPAVPQQIQVQLPARRRQRRRRAREG